jgi:uncharacterized Zn finger protein (UPF0148 family)
MSDAPGDTCPHCGETLVKGKTYCPNCGQVIAPADQKTAIDAYIAAKVAQELALKTQNEASIVRDIGYKAENEVRGRLKLYSWVTVIIVAALTVYGVKSIGDARKKIVDEATSRVEQIVTDVEKRAKAAQTRLVDIEARVSKVGNDLPSIENTVRQAQGLTQKVEQLSAKSDAQAAAILTQQAAPAAIESVEVASDKLWVTLAFPPQKNTLSVAEIKVVALPSNKLMPVRALVIDRDRIIGIDYEGSLPQGTDRVQVCFAKLLLRVNQQDTPVNQACSSGRVHH